MKHLVRLWTKRAGMAALLSALTLPLLTSATSSFAQDEPEVLPERVTAVYRIKFGVLGDIGWFSFTSKLDGDDYKLIAHAKVDTAVFDYVGKMVSEGAVKSFVAKPADYKFSFRQKALFGKKKRRSLKMAFDKTGVTKIKFTPPDPPSSKAIPITEEHLKGALDPLSGVMALSLGDLSKPCDQRLPIFDGKQRFDIVFKRARPAPRAAPQVCNVHLHQIAGHKKGKGAAPSLPEISRWCSRPCPRPTSSYPRR